MDTATSIYIQKTNERNVSNGFIEVTDDKGVTELLRNLESTEIVLNYVFYFINTTHCMIFIPLKTDIGYSQYDTEAATYKYLCQENKNTFISIPFIKKFGISNNVPN